MFMKVFYRTVDGVKRAVVEDDIVDVKRICESALTESGIQFLYHKDAQYIDADPLYNSDNDRDILREIGERLVANGYECENDRFMPAIEYVNCTEHDIDIVDDRDVRIRRYHPSGIVTRVATNEEIVAIIDGLRITKTTFGDVENLPEPKPNTFYIVSMAVGSACSDRGDLVGPNTGKTALRKDGKVVAARSLAQYHTFPDLLFNTEYIAGVNHAYDVLQRWSILYRSFDDTVNALIASENKYGILYAYGINAVVTYALAHTTEEK